MRPQRKGTVNEVVQGRRKGVGAEVDRQVHFTEGRGWGGVGHHGENLVIYSQHVGDAIEGL